MMEPWTFRSGGMRIFPLIGQGGGRTAGRQKPGRAVRGKKPRAAGVAVAGHDESRYFFPGFRFPCFTPPCFPAPFGTWHTSVQPLRFLDPTSPQWHLLQALW